MQCTDAKAKTAVRRAAFISWATLVIATWSPAFAQEVTLHRGELITITRDGAVNTDTWPVDPPKLKEMEGLAKTEHVQYVWMDRRGKVKSIDGRGKIEPHIVPVCGHTKLDLPCDPPPSRPCQKVCITDNQGRTKCYCI